MGSCRQQVIVRRCSCLTLMSSSEERAGEGRGVATAPAAAPATVMRTCGVNWMTCTQRLTNYKPRMTTFLKKTKKNKDGNSYMNAACDNSSDCKLKFPAAPIQETTMIVPGEDGDRVTTTTTVKPLFSKRN